MVPRLIQNLFRLVTCFAFCRLLWIIHLTPLWLAAARPVRPCNLSQIVLCLPRGPVIFQKFDVRVRALLGEQVIDAADVAQPELWRTGRQAPGLQDRLSGMSHEIVGCV